MEKEILQNKLKRLSDELAELVYPLTFDFPKCEQYALADQIRRCILSVPSNLYEGFARETDAERKRFVNISYGSLAEFRYQIYFAQKRNYINKEDYMIIKNQAESLSKLLYSFYKKLKADC